VILLIDNYDSFVYNLARYVRELGHDAVVRRHDAMTLDEIAALAPSHIVISPGPCTPHEAGISTEVVRHFGSTVPILGVCLGHQCIGEAYGGRIVRAARPMHGKVSQVTHDGTSVFAGLPSPFRATRYHSLIIERETLPSALRATAWTESGEIMGVVHESHPVTGVQFHPESALTEYGYRILDTFLSGRRTDRAVADGADGALGGREPRDERFVPPPVELVR
jgi:anthranilate synthase component 2/para-aminobenzoate synthetase component 2